MLLGLLVLSPIIALFQMLWFEAAILDTRSALIERWSTSCSESGVYVAVTLYSEAIRKLKPGEAQQWTWPVASPFGTYTAVLDVVGADEPQVRCVCTSTPLRASTQARLHYVNRQVSIAPGSWAQCGARNPCGG